MSSKINASTSGVGGLVSTADNSGILELQSGGNTKFTVSSEGAYGTLRMEAAKAATGTAVDFTGIPAWVKKITVLFAGVSSNGTSSYVVRIGGASGISATSYEAGSTHFSSNAVGGEAHTTGFGIRCNQAAILTSGNMFICRMSDIVWTQSNVFGGSSTNFSVIGGGMKVLNEPLTQLRITTINGTDVFDAGYFSLILEG